MINAAKFALLACLAIATSTVSTAQDFSFSDFVPPYAGQWEISSSGGYTGSLSLDGFGGCSYFLSSAFLTLQASCQVREIDANSIIIFGSQEGSSNSAPIYGDQLTTPTTQAPSIVVNFQITNIGTNQMTGKLFAGGRPESVTFSR